jgi:hypothetical protein
MMPTLHAKVLPYKITDRLQSNPNKTTCLMVESQGGTKTLVRAVSSRQVTVPPPAVTRKSLMRLGL